MTPQRCELCDREFTKYIKKFDSFLLGYSFYLCKSCLDHAVTDKINEVKRGY